MYSDSGEELGAWLRLEAGSSTTSRSEERKRATVTTPGARSDAADSSTDADTFLSCVRIVNRAAYVLGAGSQALVLLSALVDSLELCDDPEHCDAVATASSQT